MSPKKSSRFLLIIMAFFLTILAVPIHSVYATKECESLDKDTLEFYAKNNILYYCPKLKASTTSSSTSCISITNGSGDNASLILGYLMEKGYSKLAAAAIIGNLYAESGLDPYIRQDGGSTDESWRAWDGGKTFSGAFGLAQWDYYTRVQALQEKADSLGLPVVSLQAQLEFLFEEMMQYGVGPGVMNSYTDVSEATLFFMNQYEKPGIPRSEVRIAYAQSVLGGTEPSDPGFETQCSDDSGELESGGISDGEESEIMNIYRECAQDTSIRTDTTCAGATVQVPSDGACTGGTLNNCSAFSQWFVNKYSTISSGLYQGSQFVSNLASKGVSTGKVPQLYAIVSMGPQTGSADGWSNHTGVVLGIDESTDTIIIGEASCSRGFSSSFPNAHTYSLSAYTNSSSPYGPTYAYINVKGL